MVKAMRTTEITFRKDASIRISGAISPRVVVTKSWLGVRMSTNSLPSCSARLIANY